MSVRAAAIGLGLLLGLGRGGLAAQELPLKVVSVSASAAEGCPPQAAALATRSRHSGVDSLLAAGSRAAILGDYPAAEDLLRKAAALDGGNAVVSYRLARTLDDQGKGEPAALEYCRYLALAPDAQDAPEIRERLQSLLGSRSVSLTDPWTREMASAADAHRAGRFGEAVDGFTRALALAPDAADGYYDRAVSYLAMDRNDPAAADLESYLRLAPGAQDADFVRARLGQLRAPAPSATVAAPPPPRRTSAASGRVLVEGLVLPGLGQHETGRTLLGLGVLSAVGGAVYFGLREEVGTQQRQGMDPFGNPYSYDVRVRHRPNLGLGIGAAVAIGVAAALESFLYARRQPDQMAEAPRGRGSAREGLALERSGEVVRVGLRFSLGGR